MNTTGPYLRPAGDWLMANRYLQAHAMPLGFEVHPATLHHEHSLLHFEGGVSKEQQEKWVALFKQSADAIIENSGPQAVCQELNKLIASEDLSWRMKMALRILRDQMSEIKRKDNRTPTAAHALGAAALVAKHNNKPDVVIAALVHDLPEERPYLGAFIKLFFALGWPVTNTVWLCTDYFRGAHNPVQVELRTRLLKKIHQRADRNTLHVLLAEKIDGVQSLIRGAKNADSAVDFLQNFSFRSGITEYEAYMLAIYKIAAKKLPPNDPLAQQFREDFGALLALEGRDLPFIEETSEHETYMASISG